MKTFFQTVIRLGISTATGYFASFMLSLFSVGGAEDSTKAFSQVYMQAEGNPLVLRILFYLAWFAGFIYLMYRLSLDPNGKTTFLNDMRNKPYFYVEERKNWWKSAEWIPVLFACVIWALVVPAFAYVPFIYPAKVLFAFATYRFFVAFDRYVWCCERLGGLEGVED